MSIKHCQKEVTWLGYVLHLSTAASKDAHKGLGERRVYWTKAPCEWARVTVRVVQMGPKHWQATARLATNQDMLDGAGTGSVASITGRGYRASPLDALRLAIYHMDCMRSGIAAINLQLGER